MSREMLELGNQLVILILQFLCEEKYDGTVHKLEQESKLYFNLKYFEAKVMQGEWDAAEKYISSFTEFNDNSNSLKIMFEMSKQKYFEALDRQDRTAALNILVNDLQKFAVYNGELYKEITQLITLHNFRDNPQLSHYGNSRDTRMKLMVVLKSLIRTNPQLKDKLDFPTVKSNRLRVLINQSLNWQHQDCKHTVGMPEIKSLFVDHSCPPPVAVPHAFVPATVILPHILVPAALPFPPVEFPASFPSMEGAVPPYQAPGEAGPSRGQKRRRTPQVPCSLFDPKCTGLTAIDRMAEELRLAKSNSEVGSQTSRQLQTSWLVENLPRTVVYSLCLGSAVTSMDFHPYEHVLLLVGDRNGEISMWELDKRERVASKPFKLGYTPARSPELQSALAEEGSISVSCVKWSPHGKFFGVAFTRNLIQLYDHPGDFKLSRYLEINAHDGGVNDLAFDQLQKELCMITCGDDKLIKVWDTMGQNLFTFEGHEAPVYSVCSHHDKDAQFIYSTSTDGKIKTWVYNHEGRPRSGCDAPGNWRTTLLFSRDSSRENRMFSCGISKEGDTFLVQWNANEGRVHEGSKRIIYSGFSKKSEGVVHFDTMKNHFLAVGEDGQIKYWDMNHPDILTSTNANGGLPSRPRLKFNSEGSLLAVTTADDGFTVLANGVGQLRVWRPAEPNILSTVSPANKATGSSSGAIVIADNRKSLSIAPAKPPPSRH